MIPGSWPPLATGARFTQPRDHTFAQPCTCRAHVMLDGLTDPIAFDHIMHEGDQHAMSHGPPLKRKFLVLMHRVRPQGLRCGRTCGRYNGHKLPLQCYGKNSQFWSFCQRDSYGQKCPSTAEEKLLRPQLGSCGTVETFFLPKNLSYGRRSSFGP